MKNWIFLCFLFPMLIFAQQEQDSLAYKKRVLANTEVDFLASYYTQDGNNAAVSGGVGTEELTDATSAIVVSIPMNADDVLTVDAGISAYTSASSSNINPFDGGKDANPFQASSGASSSDLWTNLTGSYSHSSDDRNRIWGLHGSMSTEYDYFSLGIGGSYSMAFNEKNTEITLKANAYFDTWKRLYPYELRPFTEGGQGLNDNFYNSHTITGNTAYSPLFTELTEKKRNSYAAGLVWSQVFTKNMQASFLVDVVKQQGLLSTPFQRVYFADVADSYIEDFQLADDIERLPDNRFKIAVGARLNYYLNEIVVLRGFYRYYTDDWGITSQTASLEVPIKLGSKFTLYPSYRYYNQTAADYFAPYESHVSTETYYTSDYDLSKFNANQYGLGITYTDIFTGFRLWKLGLKSIDLKYNYYERNTGLSANIILFGVKFVAD